MGLKRRTEKRKEMQAPSLSARMDVRRHPTHLALLPDSARPVLVELLEAVPEDVLVVIVRTLMAHPRRPAALIALTSTCRQLRALRPPGWEGEAARDTISHTLDVRPTPSELFELGIMPCAPTTAPRLAEAQRSLAREMTRDAVTHCLESRPKETELRQQGILKGRVSARLAETAEQLEKKLLRVSLKHGVERRPTAADVRSLGIVRTPAALSSRLASVADRLEIGLRRDSLTHCLERRRSVSELHTRGIVKGIVKGAPGLSALVLEAREALQRSRVRSALAASLEERPCDLVELVPAALGGRPATQPATSCARTAAAPPRPAALGPRARPLASRALREAGAGCAGEAAPRAVPISHPRAVAGADARDEGCPLAGPDDRVRDCAAPLRPAGDGLPPRLAPRLAPRGGGELELRRAARSGRF